MAQQLTSPSKNIVIGDRAKRLEQMIEHVNVLHGAGQAESYFTIAQRSIDLSKLVIGADGQVESEYRWMERSYTLQKFVQYVQQEWGQRSFEDVYCSPNRTFIPRRGIQYIKELGWLYADLDWTPKFQWSFEEIVEKLSEEVFDRKLLPVPNFFLQTRHCSLFWKINIMTFSCKEQMSDALEKWDAVMAYIGGVLKPYGLDFAATDASRVFRLAGSIHGKTGTDVRLHWIQDDQLSLNDWLTDFDIEYIPWRIRKMVDQQKKVAKKSKQLALDIGTDNNFVSASLDTNAEIVTFPRRNEYTLVKQRITDLFRLHQLRAENGASYGIRRRVSVFLVCYWSICLGLTEDAAIGQALELNQLFRVPLKQGEFDANCRYAIDVATTDPIDPGRRRYDYKFAAKLAIKNVTLVEWLAITDHEQSHMKTIFTKQEKLNRLTEKRRKSGVKSREEYLGSAQDKKQKAIQLRQTGMTVAQIAQELGTSERTVKRYCNS